MRCDLLVRGDIYHASRRCRLHRCLVNHRDIHRRLRSLGSLLIDFCKGRDNLGYHLCLYPWHKDRFFLAVVVVWGVGVVFLLHDTSRVLCVDERVRSLFGRVWPRLQHVSCAILHGCVVLGLAQARQSSFQPWHGHKCRGHKVAHHLFWLLSFGSSAN